MGLSIPLAVQLFPGQQECWGCRFNPEIRCSLVPVTVQYHCVQQLMYYTCKATLEKNRMKTFQRCGDMFSPLPCGTDLCRATQLQLLSVLPAAASGQSTLSLEMAEKFTMTPFLPLQNSTAATWSAVCYNTMRKPYNVDLLFTDAEVTQYKTKTFRETVSLACIWFSTLSAYWLLSTEGKILSVQKYLAQGHLIHIGPRARTFSYSYSKFLSLFS